MAQRVLSISEGVGHIVQGAIKQTGDVLLDFLFQKSAVHASQTIDDKLLFWCFSHD